VVPPGQQTLLIVRPEGHEVVFALTAEDVTAALRALL
jgi:heme/copper-type cytochrome/quinol oxidase subunit 2